MSQVLVSPAAIHSLAGPMRPLVEAMEPPTSQLHLNAVNLPGDREVCVASVEEKRMASQLAYLASQHHTSEYNRLKFGPAGAPVMYIPISIQLPAQVQEMKARQARNAHKRTWWPAELSVETRTRDLDPFRSHAQGCDLEPPQQENVIPCAQVSCATEPDLDDLPVNPNKPAPPLNHPPAQNLQRELSVAMSSPLSIITIPQLSPRVTCHQPNLNIHAKTSESHPINISPIVPFELLPLISSHLVPTSPHTSYMFDLPPSLFLNHIAMHASPIPADAMRPYPMIRTPNGGLWAYPNNAGPSPPAFPPSTWSKPFHNGISESTVAVNRWTSTTHSGNFNNSFDTLSNSPDATSQPDNASTLSRPPSAKSIVSQHGSLLLPTSQGRPHSAPPSLMSSLAGPPEMFANGGVVPPPLPELVHAMSSDILNNDEDIGRSDSTGVSLLRGADISLPITWAHNISPPYVPPPMLGNMLLSSCPGKKVRLSGPVKGRGAICRDLGHDLKRVRALGVGCIICCLDDEELEFLGASWPQYSEVARGVGLDVLRIPIPEGLAPSAPAQLDEHLSRIIRSFTLKGIPVLVHCRGGVGRAGLVACCWMLKLGLCGWISHVAEMNGHAHQRHGEMVKVRKEAVELVERVIAVVRRRRSVKAIETYEQVRFLVEFVEHLRANSSGTS